MRHVVSYSGGVGSWGAAKRVVDRYGTDGVVLLFADTKMEDGDLYRFLHEGAECLGLKVTTIADGRTPWQVFWDERFMGNHRVDPCSKHLKRNLLDKWMEDNLDPTEAVRHLGIDATEAHRLDRYRDRIGTEWSVEAPLMWSPPTGKPQVFEWLKEAGIKPPRLYAMGFQHNNCGGFCIKTGQAQFALLHRTMPERYRQHEEEQERLFEHIGSRHGFIRVTRDGEKAYLGLREFREQYLEVQLPLFDEHDWGGCGCALE